MKRFLTLSLLILAFTLSATAQKIEKPKLVSQPPTAEQLELIHQGVALHDEKNYDGAIQKFEAVLQQNPDCTQALWELANTLYVKPDRGKAESVARKGAQYRSPELPLFYGLIGNLLDDAGKASDAIELYLAAGKIVRGDRDLRPYLAPINYNLAVTYVREKKYAEMRPVLKEGIEADFSHVSSHYLMAELFYGTQYKVPALLAAARFLGLEQETTRTKRAAAIFVDILKTAHTGGGNINITMNMNAPKDEGDFTIFDLLLGTMATTSDEKDKNKTDEQRYASALDSLIAILVEDKDYRSTFIGRTYIPYMEAMKKAGQSETLAYLVLQQNGSGKAAQWFKDNPGKLTAYYTWTKAYRATAK